MEYFNEMILENGNAKPKHYDYFSYIAYSLNTDQHQY